MNNKKKKKKKHALGIQPKPQLIGPFFFPSCQVIAPLVDHQNRLYLYLFFSQRSAIPIIFFLKIIVFFFSTIRSN